jgi:hypothetical protein
VIYKCTLCCSLFVVDFGIMHFRNFYNAFPDFKVFSCAVQRQQIQNERAAKSCLQLKSQSTMQSPPLQRDIAVQGSLQQGKATACAILRPLIDGYNWRKYNEIIPPGTSCPRVFYGCTNMGCIARKIEEHSPTGHVRHIYEGSHNHLQPRKAMALIRSCKKKEIIIQGTGER